MQRAWWVVVVSLCMALPARADLSTYPDRLSLRPYFLPDSVDQLAVEGGVSQRGMAEVTLDADLALSSVIGLDLALETETYDGPLLSPLVQMKIAFTPDIGLLLRGALTTDLNGVLFDPAFGLAARVHLSSMVALDVPGAVLEYGAIAGAPCLDPITASSFVSPPSGYSGTVTARCLNPNGLDVRASFVDDSSLPPVLAIVLPVGLIVSPTDLVAFDLGVKLTYGVTGQPPSTVAVSVSTPVAPLIPDDVELRAGAWITQRAFDLGLHLGYVSYFSSSTFGSLYLASLEARIR